MRECGETCKYMVLVVLSGKIRYTKKNGRLSGQMEQEAAERK